MDLTQLMELAQAAAREAGGVLRQGSELRSVNFQDAKDIKLQADVRSEALIRERLAQGSEFPIIGEEHGGDASLPGRDTPYWVVDPLDGTYNYFRDMGLCCVSIGLMRGLEPLLGVIYDFNTEQWFTAAPGVLPLEFNGRVHRPLWAEKHDHAVLACGFPAGRSYTDESLRGFVQQVQTFKKIRMLGSAAIAMAYVAVGRADAYMEESIRLWDIAAGLALGKAAGAAIRLEPVPDGPPFAYVCGIAARQEWL